MGQTDMPRQLTRIFSFLYETMKVGELMPKGAIPDPREAVTCVLKKDIEGSEHRIHPNPIFNPYRAYPVLVERICNLSRPFWNENVWGPCDGTLQIEREKTPKELVLPFPTEKCIIEENEFTAGKDPKPQEGTNEYEEYEIAQEEAQRGDREYEVAKGKVNESAFDSHDRIRSKGADNEGVLGETQDLVEEHSVPELDLPVREGNLTDGGTPPDQNFSTNADVNNDSPGETSDYDVNTASQIRDAIEYESDYTSEYEN